MHIDLAIHAWCDPWAVRSSVVDFRRFPLADQFFRDDFAVLRGARLCHNSFVANVINLMMMSIS